MAGEVRSQVGGLERAAQMVSGARSDLDKQCDAVRKILDDVGVQWEGAGAAAFTEVLQQWDQHTRKVVTTLNDFEHNLKVSERSYAEVEEGARAKMTKAQRRLGPG